MWFLIGFIACAGKPVNSACPVEISPPTVTVRIGDPLSANCSATSDLVLAMGWESTVGGTTRTPGVTSLPLAIASVIDWVLEPICFVNLKNQDQCSQTLPVTIYKTPASVSVSTLNQIGPLAEGERYSLQCDIVDVAPVRNLTVQWHKGNKTLYTETFDESSVYPLNKSSILNQTAHRDDNGTQIWCEAKLNLPDLPPIKSKPQEVIVLYTPIFANPANETLELQAGSKLILNCTATGNPIPAYSWHFQNPRQLTNGNQNSDQPILTQTFEHPGIYNCTASNSQGTRTRYFTVTEAPNTRQGTTAGIVSAVFVVFFIILVLVVYQKKRNSFVARPASLS